MSTDVMSTTPSYFVRSQLPLRAWVGHAPEVSAARPSHCPACQAPSQPLGKPLVLHGHGLRTRTLLCDGGSGRPLQAVTLTLRRFLCTACGVALTVGPREMLPHRRFSLELIVLALALWSLLRQSVATARAQLDARQQRLSRTWTQVYRWAQVLPTLLPRANLWTGDRETIQASMHRLWGWAPPASRMQAPERQAMLGAVRAL